jgi:hypothetical protein
MFSMPSYPARFIAFILMGVSSIKNSISYVWLFELVESRHKPAACTFMNVLDTGTMVIFGFYLLFVSKDWFPLYFGAMSVTAFSLAIVIILMPESPKWLLINKSQKEAIEQFNYIGRFNRSDRLLPEHAQFIEAQVAGTQEPDDEGTDQINVSISINKVARELLNLRQHRGADADEPQEPSMQL